MVQTDSRRAFRDHYRARPRHNFITVLINFLILAWIIFLMIKAVNNLRRRLAREEKVADVPAAPPADFQLLTEIRDLLDWIREFAAGGGTVVLITHKLRDALAVADDVTVLRRGRIAYQGPAAGATETELGRAMFAEAPEPDLGLVGETQEHEQPVGGAGEQPT